MQPVSLPTLKSAQGASLLPPDAPVGTRDAPECSVDKVKDAAC